LKYKPNTTWNFAPWEEANCKSNSRMNQDGVKGGGKEKKDGRRKEKI
jgi:hypothetical protein